MYESHYVTLYATNLKYICKPQNMSGRKIKANTFNTCNSAKQKLGLLYRNFHQAYQKTRGLTHLYKSLILPKLDYCSCVWDPHTASLIDSLESVQSFAAKLCSKCWSAPSAEV